MNIIVGLGNPGLRYKATRHNVGFQAIDRFAKANRLRFKARRYFDSWMAEGKLNGESILLLKPLTYMNLSGVAVAAAVANKVGAVVGLEVAIVRFTAGSGILVLLLYT